MEWKYKDFCFLQMDRDILRRNYVALISDLREQEILCDMLVQKNVLGFDDRDEVLSERTNGAKNRVLLDYIRCRFKYGFPVFCEGLEKTRQFTLLELMQPQRVQAEVKQSNECKICLSLPVKVAFSPCGHACCCEQCAQEVKICPLCRASIQQKLKIYIG